MKKTQQYEPRELMELAIEVMRQSLPEPRPDGKASPKVGAVLVKPDGTVETACRGELRHGDHAEFTILERKNRGNKLDDQTCSVLHRAHVESESGIAFRLCENGNG